jgi:hypothetical protein
LQLHSGAAIASFLAEEGKLMKFLLPLALVCAFLVSCRTNESPEGQVDDLEIVAQAKSKLASDVAPSTVVNISVNSTNGVVTLAGQVDSSDLKAKAETVVKAVPKVVKVVNNLQVVTKPASQ